MKMFVRAAIVPALVVALYPSTVYSQSLGYGTPTSANPAKKSFFRRGETAYASPRGSYYYGGTPGVQNPYTQPGEQTAPAQAAPAQQDPARQDPATAAPERVEEVIPYTEQPKANSAVTAAAESAPAGSVSYLNRQINFPRDRGDDIDILKLQVFLDYHGYSPAEIDGRWGYNVERALYVYQRNNGMPETGQLDERMLARLNAFKDGYLLEYTVTGSEASGPYFHIPRDYYQQAKMKWLPYESAVEALAEKFHCSQSLLRKLNPGVDFDNIRGGQRILGLNVLDGIDEKRGKVATIRVSKHNKWTETFDAEGRFMFYYPSTLGSEHDPLPLGNYSVASVVKNPPFKFQPSLFYDWDKNAPEAMIPPGPNSPVGVVWIGTTRKSVGIHGTPNPEFISKNTSHGCIRLTNWDALQLSKRVAEGATKIQFVD